MNKICFLLGLLLGEKLHITMGLRCSILWTEPSQKHLVHFGWWDLVKIWRRHPELLQRNFFLSNGSDLAGTWPWPLCELYMGRRCGPGHFGHKLGTVQDLLLKAVLHPPACNELWDRLLQSQNFSSSIVATGREKKLTKSSIQYCCNGKWEKKLRPTNKSGQARPPQFLTSGWLV